MKNCMLVLFASFLAITGCQKEDLTDKPIIEVRQVPEDGIVINKWQMLGPFPVDSQQNPIDYNNLGCFGFEEAEIAFKDFLKISRNHAKDTCRPDTTFINKYIFSGATPIEFKELPGISEKELNGDYYFACQIRCQRAVSTRLHFSSNARAKIWLNNKLLCRADYSLPMAAYREYRPVVLEKGDNFLLIKISNPNISYEMYARLENESKRGMERYYGLYNRGILDGCIYIWGDSIKQNNNFPPSNGKIRIMDSSNKLIIQDSIHEGKRWGCPMSVFRNGNYRVEAKIGDITLVQDIYRGVVTDSIQSLLDELRSVEVSNKVKPNIEALDFRFNHLQKNTWWGDPKYVGMFIQLRDIHANLKQGIDPFNHTKGCFIRSYLSEIDSSRQYYILHVPSSYKRGDVIPVGVAVPVNVYDKFPYLQSFRVANSKLIDFFQDLSEKYNMIIIEPGSRRKNEANHNPIEETEFFAILNDVEADYDIDRNRIYLAGTCSGGNELIKMAVKYPDLFAAVGMVAPDIVYPDENANPWVKANIPVMFLGNNKQLPIFDTHSVIDRHVPIESSENLNKVAGYYQLENFHYVKIPNEFPKYYPDDFYDDIFKFTRDYALKKNPERVDLTTNQMLYNKSFWVTINDMKIPGEAHIRAIIRRNKLTVQKENITAYTIDLTTLPYTKNEPLKIIDNGKLVFNNITDEPVLYFGPERNPDALKKNHLTAGPFAHVFAQRFIVVKGTSGTRSEKEGIAAMADTINKYWDERYFTDCLVKNDFEISEKDMENSSLVLLGNPGSNLLIKRLQNDIPLLVSDTGIRIKDKKIEGERLCFYMIYPNPVNKNRYVAVIGYNHAGFISLGSEDSDSFNDVSNYGWYDYKVWDDRTHAVIEKGYFDSSWN